MSPKTRDIKERINKWNLFKIKTFCIAKEKSIEMKRETTIWENIFAKDASDKSLIFKIYKELQDSTLARQTTQLKNGQKTLTDTSPRRTLKVPRDIQNDAQHWWPSERCKLKPQ